MLKFNQLPIGATFDFVSPNGAFNSFYDRCQKISPRKYKSLQTGAEYTVGSVLANTYHPDMPRKDAAA
jgi:hypothetical protein